MKHPFNNNSNKIDTYRHSDSGWSCFTYITLLYHLLSYANISDLVLSATYCSYQLATYCSYQLAKYYSHQLATYCSYQLATYCSYQSVIYSIAVISCLTIPITAIIWLTIADISWLLTITAIRWLPITRDLGSSPSSSMHPDITHGFRSRPPRASRRNIDKGGFET